MGSVVPSGTARSCDVVLGRSEQSPRVVFCHRPAHDLDVGPLAVDKNRKSVGRQAAIVNHGQVDPLLNRQRLATFYTDRVSGPEVNQRGTQSALFDQQLIAAAGRIGPGPRAMKNDLDWIV